MFEDDPFGVRIEGFAFSLIRWMGCRKAMIRSLSLVAVCMVFVSCAQGPGYTERTLPSGRTVKIKSVMPMAFADGPALMLRYYTGEDMTDRVALRAEAEEIMKAFGADVEKAGLESAILSASLMPEGMFTVGTMVNFVFRRLADGSWELTDDAGDGSAGPKAQPAT